MSFDVSVFGIGIPTDSTSLKSFRDELNLAFSLDQTLTSFLDGPLSGVPSSASVSKVSYTSPTVPLLPAGAPVNFGISGSVSGEFDIVLSGDLVPYTDGLDNPKQTSIPVPPHTAYTKLTLNVSITAQVSGSGSYSRGLYGVKGSAGTTDTYAITFCKAFDPSTPVKTAIAQTFQSFVLPLTATTITDLASGDYLLHEFEGSFNLSFGAFAGFDQVLYSGQSTVDVLSVKNSQLATLTARAKPEIKADAELDFTFQYATKFEGLVSRIGNTSTFHLFRSSKADATATLSAGLTFNANASAKLSTSVSSLASSVGSASGSSIVSTVANAASGAITQGVTDANNAVSKWLNRANGLKANLQVAIESIQSRTLLAAYDFDLTNASPTGVTQAWTLAVSGDLVAALNYRDPATGQSFVTLEIGSGLESEYQRKTSFSCNFFNLWHFSTWDQWQSGVSMVYAGNNVFHMTANVGRATETDYVGASKNINFYFAASADQATNGVISKPSVDLHIDLTVQGAPTAARQIAGMLAGIGGCQTCKTVSLNMNAFIDAAQSGTVQLNITIPSAAYGYIAADPVTNSPTPASTVDDQKNWNAFSQATDALGLWTIPALPNLNMLPFIKSYAGWADLNAAFNGATTPDRTAFGNRSSWPHDCLGDITDDLTRQAVFYAVSAGQCFMNLCASLQQLALAVDVNGAGITWSQFLAMITAAVKDYQQPDFARPIALALIWLCGSSVTSISAPSDANASTGKFQVKLNM